MELQLPKGTRDFNPELKIVRDKIVETLKNVYELYGFSPLETPIIERYETLSSKYAGGSEILKEIFKLKDQGNRELGLRYDLTVPLCRVIGMNPTIKLPFKRYQFGDVFRDGPIKKGRYRVFTQADADIVGCKEMTAETEIINLTLGVFERLNLDIIIKINNRKILNGILEYAGIKKEKEEVILSIDKLDKFGKDIVKKELKEKKVPEESTKKIFDVISIKNSFNEKIKILKDKLKDNEGINEVEKLFGLIENKNNIEFDLSLARGLSYYTGTVFEVFLKNSEFKSSLAAGGRYDEIIGSFLNSKQEYRAVGISFGLDVLMDVINIKEKKKTVAQVYIIPIQTFKESLRIADKLRKKGIKTDIDLMGKGISKNLNYANAMQIPYVIFVGEDELRQNKVKLKDMKKGKEDLLNLEEAYNIIIKTCQPDYNK